jgi:hypothetical protein
MNEYQKHLLTKGYILLELGSYRRWMGKRWHEFFVRSGWVRRNLYGQYNPNTKTLGVFAQWLTLYDKAMHDRDYPHSFPHLSADETIKIKTNIITY